MTTDYRKAAERLIGDLQARASAPGERATDIHAERIIIVNSPQTLTININIYTGEARDSSEREGAATP